ncbi:hypothetical protein NJB14197_25000 [Mycobacterium montefiorense]|uniref:Uncharacterized protein n=1 Tax=Mycobacterium montefiorense TaxID=154654 RepID=A0AA37PNP9_9MYCO|nr:hypothetical protein [Mycobacterium montefiorense]GBG37670.1 hypothetical protein MmonteBS_20420 [Mycobacterium montefiorense]GKU34807.1 hypothetical protein NJB14191_21530 [Mycobacterium montefiorense]GKU40821.1 hypothetical protein NJB14192_28070 [Mycobacterium montefiorense]GKU46928.1 hypothetical protein NJB14194_35460 [Mycobacterium montefiorense]GKU49048.1 hypothetical protein NJB14195_02950 [Mycobacterium montefiorense]
MTTWSTTGARFGQRLGSLAIAGVAATGIVLIANINRPPVALASDDAVAIVPGITVTPAPGWTVADRGPDWVALANANSSAQLQVAVKPPRGTDLVGLLQADIDQLTGTPSAGFADVKDLTGPTIIGVRGNKFQQEAFINYTATVSGPQGAVPVMGTFSELLNTASHQTAFIDFRQDNNATAQAVNDGGAMVNSLL